MTSLINPSSIHCLNNWLYRQLRHLMWNEIKTHTPVLNSFIFWTNSSALTPPCVLLEADDVWDEATCPHKKTSQQWIRGQNRILTHSHQSNVVPLPHQELGPGHFYFAVSLSTQEYKILWTNEHRETQTIYKHVHLYMP